MSNDESVEVRFDRRTTELDALQRAAYALARMMTIDIKVDGSDFACWLSHISHQSAGTAEQLLRREVFDQTLRVRIGRETEHIRDLIFAVAFSQTGLVEGTGSGSAASEPIAGDPSNS